MLLGYKLKMFRLANNKTQAEVADWCNLSVRYIGMIEKGDEKPSEETYRAIINCINGVGSPLPKIPRCNTKVARGIE